LVGLALAAGTSRIRVLWEDESNYYFVPQSINMTIDDRAVSSIFLADVGSGETLPLIEASLAPGSHEVGVFIKCAGHSGTEASAYSWTLKDKRLVTIVKGQTTTLRVRFDLIPDVHFTDQPRVGFEP
jgi:hypothetical protein